MIEPSQLGEVDFFHKLQVKAQPGNLESSEDQMLPPLATQIRVWDLCGWDSDGYQVRKERNKRPKCSPFVAKPMLSKITMALYQECQAPTDEGS